MFAAFISVFAADVFGEGLGFWRTLVALAMHLIPTAIILIVLAVAWRWEAMGGTLLILMGLGYTTMVVKGHHPISWILAIAGPAYLVWTLFVLSSKYGR